MVGTVDVLLGNLEDAVKADRKEAARAGLVDDRQGDRLRRAHPAVDPRQRPRQPVGARRPDHPRHRDRRQARRHHGAQGAGRRGHPLRRPAARPARGQGRADPADPRPRDPRDGPRRGQRRGDRRRQPAHAGPLARPGRPRRRPPDEDHPRRRRPPRLPRRARTRSAATSTGAARDLPAGPVALHDRPHGRRLRDARDLPVLRPVRRHQGRRRLRGPVPQRLPARLRRRLVAAPGADRHRQAGLQPVGRRRRARPPRHRRRWATAPAPSCSTARWRTTPASSSASSSSSSPSGSRRPTPSSPSCTPTHRRAGPTPSPLARPDERRTRVERTVRSQHDGRRRHTGPAARCSTCRAPTSGRWRRRRRSPSTR